ncbi:MAG TPA: hypothetical protein VM009_06440, partial [Terriglobales bacterium]|nr:hypothetical protein [Terriglobales bacterium]
ANVERRKKVEANPNEALEQAKALPVDSGRNSPRLMALTQVVFTSARVAPSTAAVAIDEMFKVIPNLSPEVQVQHLRAIAQGSEMIEDDARVLKAVRMGFKAADMLYLADTDASDPNTSPKESWPSTAAWKRFLTLEAALVPLEVTNDLATIEDAEIRAIAKVELARNYMNVRQFTSAAWRITKKNSSGTGMF